MRSFSARWLVGVAVVIIVGFAASTLLLLKGVARIDQQVVNIALNAQPSVTGLAAARAEMRHIEMGVGRYFGAKKAGHPIDRRQFDRWRATLEQHLGSHESSPFFPGELQLYDDFRSQLRKVEVLSEHALDLVDAGRRDEARKLVFEQLDPAGDRLDAITLRLISANSALATQSAREIDRIRRRASLLAIALDGAVGLFGIVLLVIALRATSTHERLTEERKCMAEARAVELDRFAARVAHDLKGPLSAMLMSTELAERSPAKGETLWPRIRRSAQTMNAMIEALLDFARAGAQPEAGAISPVATVIEQVAADVEVSAREAGAELHLTMSAPGCVVACSTGALVSITSNLLQNAVKHIADAKAERRIEVRVNETATHVCIEVDDTGPGIEPALLPRIFDLYVRGHGKPGLGLGLATVRRLVEAYGGKVGVRSVPARGACFWVKLPRGAAVASPARSHEPAPTHEPPLPA